MNAAQLVDTYARACAGSLAAIVAWDTMRLAERRRDLLQYPTARNRRRVRYMERKLAAMQSDLRRAA